MGAAAGVRLAVADGESLTPGPLGAAGARLEPGSLGELRPTGSAVEAPDAPVVFPWAEPQPRTNRRGRR